MKRDNVKVVFLTIMWTLVIVLFVVLMVGGCNKTVVDTVYKYDRAIISFPNGQVVEGEVESWTDYTDGDQIQVQIDGKVYLVHSSNIWLIKE